MLLRITTTTPQCDVINAWEFGLRSHSFVPGDMLSITKLKLHHQLTENRELGSFFVIIYAVLC